MSMQMRFLKNPKGRLAVDAEPGTVRWISRPLALQLINQGFAEPWAPTEHREEAEVATVAPEEKAVREPGKPKKRGRQKKNAEPEPPATPPPSGEPGPEPQTGEQTPPEEKTESEPSGGEPSSGGENNEPQPPVGPAEENQEPTGEGTGGPGGPAGESNPLGDIPKVEDVFKD